METFMTEWLPGLVIVYAAFLEIRLQLQNHALRLNEAKVRRLSADLRELATYVLTLSPGMQKR